MALSNFFWDSSKPINSLLIPDIPQAFRFLNGNISSLFGSEHHTFPTGSNTGAWHLPGSAVAWYQASAPTTRIDTSAFDSNDLGRLWVDSDDDQPYVLTATTPTWVSLNASLLAGTNTWAGIQTFSETPVLSTQGDGLNPVGSIVMFAGSSEPTGWLFCDGATGLSTVANPEYTELFAIIGTTYGGTGTTDFDLPDMRGRIPLGVGTGDASDATAHTLAQKQGTEKHALAELEMPSHRHNWNTSNTSGTNIGASAGGKGDATQNVFQTGFTGGVTAHNNLQPSLGLNFIIKY